jgi:hypothetical protein
MERLANVSSVDDLLTDEQQKALTADLRRIAKQRRRGEDAAAQFVFGNLDSTRRNPSHKSDADIGSQSEAAE